MPSYSEADVDAAAADLMERLRVKGNYKPLTPERAKFRVKSTELAGDRRLKEMEHFLQSHTYLDRIKNRSTDVNTAFASDAQEGYESEQHVASPRCAGLEKLNAELKSIATKGVSSPRSAGFSIVSGSKIGSLAFPASPVGPGTQVSGTQTSSSSSSESPRKSTGLELAVERRVQWREGMDKNLRSMLDDWQLSRQDSLASGGHKMVCEQFEKTYDWYTSSGKKSVKKEREADAYLKFDPGKEPMPGSTRGFPKLEKRGS